MGIKIATWNVNSIRMRMQHLKDFILEQNPDILLLQETKCDSSKFPALELSDLNYNIVEHGIGSYSGVAIFSKFIIDEVKTSFPNNPSPDQARFIEACINTPIGYCRIISLYAPNGGEVGSEKFEMKLSFYKALIEYLESQKKFGEKIIIGGDLNIAPYDIDVYSREEMKGQTCFTQVEKEKMRSLLNIGFEDVYRIQNPNKQEFSWWDYRAGGFEQNRGLRIDTILASPAVIGDFSAAEIHYSSRAKEKPSDHAPVIIY